MVFSDEGAPDGHGGRQNRGKGRQATERHARGLAEDLASGNVAVALAPGPR
jgi:hypothetical protein